MARTIGSIVAALAIIGVTIWMLPAAPDAAPPTASEVTGDAMAGPDGVPSTEEAPPPDNTPVPLEAHELGEELEDKLMQVCRPHADTLIAERGMELADKVGEAIKVDLGVDKGIALCKSLDGKGAAEVVAALEALVE
jgi:hypothetical protein